MPFTVSRRPIVRSIMIGLLVLSSMASFAGLLGANSEVADSFNQIAPLWSLGGGIAALTLLPTIWRARLKGWALAWLIVVAPIALHTITWSWNDRPSNGIVGGSAHQTLRVISFNLWLENPKPDRAATWLASRHADIIVLLEAAGNSRAVAAALTKAYPYRIGCRGYGHPCSTLILSRLPPTEQEGLAHGDADNRKALSAAKMGFETAEHGFSIIGVHLNRGWPVSHQHRDKDLLLAALAAEPKDSLIVVGDFNATPWTFTVRHILGQLQLRRAPGLWPSWGWKWGNIALPAILPIDHVLVGRNWQIRSIERGPDLGSDHRPLEITLVRRVS